VTVVVPLCNDAAFIGETLTSIQRQTVRDTEVIVVDDGSSDDGCEVVRGHPVGARLVEQPHLGVAVARNRGLALARACRVAFLDQDDLWHPTHAQRTLEWLDSHSGERIVFTREVTFGVADETERLRRMDQLAAGWAKHLVPSDGTLHELIRVADTVGSDGIERHDLRSLLRGPISTTTSFVADAELLMLAGGFAPHALAMDDYWLLVNVARLQPITQIDQPTVFYRVHVRATSWTTRLGLAFLSSAVALRLGGGLIPVDEGLRGGLDGKLHGHLLRELLESPQLLEPRFRGVVRHLAAIQWPPGGRQRDIRPAVLAARVPLLRRVVRAVRLPKHPARSRAGAG
jgi:glycosyltransferase involved in cell wall biosynthesis